MRLTFSKLAGAFSTVPILLACISGRATGQDPNVITPAELAVSRAENTYQAIRHIRPEMLRSRESGSLMLFGARRPAVAVNNTLVGGVEALRSIPVDQVTQLEYVSAWEAGNRYGTTFRDGILLVQTRDSSGDQLRWHADGKARVTVELSCQAPAPTSPAPFSNPAAPSAL